MRVRRVARRGGPILAAPTLPLFDNIKLYVLQLEDLRFKARELTNYLPPSPVPQATTILSYADLKDTNYVKHRTSSRASNYLDCFFEMTSCYDVLF